MKRLLPIALIAATAATLPAPLMAQSADAPMAEKDTLKRVNHHRGQRGERGRGGRGFEAILEQYDTNEDGSLTEDEALAARTAQLTEHDADGDGALTIAEYEALWLQAMRERMVDRFQQHDDDGDGAVTVAEFTEELSRMLRRADRNGDGMINSEDMRRGRDRAE